MADIILQNKIVNEDGNIDARIIDTSLQDDPFATEGYVNENGGKIDSIEVDGVEQPIVDKTVSITGFAAINEKIPAQASSSNQLADKDFVNSSIENVAAYYITKDAAGNPFATKAELTAATTFYSGGQVRVPTRNDYCVVLADESKTISETGENPTTRYLYDNNTWSYQYIVNRSGLTAAQWATLNSGIIAADKTNWDAKYTKPDRGIPDSDIASVGAGKVEGTLGVAHGGTGATTLASGQALIGNGAGAVQTRGINDATSDAQLANNNNLVTSRAVRHNSNYYLNRASSVSDSNADYSTYMARGESLNPSDTIPLKNGQIAWTYE